jgi:hypothetical protein
MTSAAAPAVTRYQRTFHGRADQVSQVRADITRHLGDCPATCDGPPAHQPAATPGQPGRQPRHPALPPPAVTDWDGELSGSRGWGRRR